MTKKLLTFLGTGNYKDVIVCYGDRRSSPSRFITESLAEIFCENWAENDEIIVFVTDTSEKKHWHSKEDSEGLNERLEKLSKKHKWKFRAVKIPEGKNEEEIWQIFNAIYESLSEKDEVILDITHGFRSIPMLCFVVLGYARFLKNIKTEAIVYGALEALGRPNEIEKMPIEERLVPLFDLTLFLRLADWTYAAKEFLMTGSTKTLEHIGKEEVKTLFKQRKGQGPKKLRKLFSLLECFRKEVETCRGPQLKETTESIHKFITESKKEIEHLPAFVPIFTKIEEEFALLETKNEIQAIHSTVKWCTKNGLIQQATTLLRENIINYLMLKQNKRDLRDVEQRREIEELLNDKETDSDVVPQELKTLWSDIIQFRNDINHAGYRPLTDYRKAEKFDDYLQKAITTFERIIQ
ncbi:MAG: TIGR02221 family CRISPR-associated protein [Candidatus Heimdallarchaeaceae archaeon]